jgi:hypothetical protein
VRNKPLWIRIHDIEARTSKVYSFDVSPVFVARGDDESLVLERSSESIRLGVFDFDDSSVRFIGLDPGSGAYLDGQAAGGGEAIVTDASELRIGRLKLTISREALAGEEMPPDVGPFDGPAVPATNPWGARRPPLDRPRHSVATAVEPDKGRTVSVPVLPVAAPASPPVTVVLPRVATSEAAIAPEPGAPKTQRLPPRSRSHTSKEASPSQAQMRRSRPRNRPQPPSSGSMLPWVIGSIAAALAGCLLAFLFFS